MVINSAATTTTAGSTPPAQTTTVRVEVQYTAVEAPHGRSKPPWVVDMGRNSLWTGEHRGRRDETTLKVGYRARFTPAGDNREKWLRLCEAEPLDTREGLGIQMKALRVVLVLLGAVVAALAAGADLYPWG